MIGAEGSMASAYAVEDYRSEVAPELIALWNGARGCGGSTSTTTPTERPVTGCC